MSDDYLLLFKFLFYCKALLDKVLLYEACVSMCPEVYKFGFLQRHVHSWAVKFGKQVCVLYKNGSNSSFLHLWGLPILPFSWRFRSSQPCPQCERNNSHLRQKSSRVRASMASRLLKWPCRIPRQFEITRIGAECSLRASAVHAALECPH